MPFTYNWLSATALLDGRVLVVGGDSLLVNLNHSTTAAIYDPATNAWSAIASPLNNSDGLTLVTLQSGKVLAIGGNDASGTHTTAELYDPGSGRWSMTGSMIGLRMGFAATLLQNGKVLAVGGIQRPQDPPVFVTIAELYDPTSGTWAATGSLRQGRYQPTATLLANGNVLVVGGSGTGSPSELSSAEIYDTNQGTWTEAASMAVARIRHTATLLKDGRVLVTGVVVSAEIYDPVRNAWTQTGPMTMSRLDHTATLQPDGTVLVAGGTRYDNKYGNGISLASADIYDPTTNAWTPTGNLSSPRAEHVAVALPSGRTLVVGGQSYGYGPPPNYSEIYGFDVPPATLTATPTGTPTATATATLKPKEAPAATPTPILLTLAPVPASIPLTVRLSSTRITAGNVMVVTVHTAPNARVTITMLAPANRTGRTGAASYRMTVHGRAGIHGRYIARLKIAFRPSLAVLANLNVEARTPDGSARRTLRVVLQPVARKR
jgi:N-acetylneuraminic acid mutarotase